MAKTIRYMRHTGVVEHTEGAKITVRITAASGCGSCRARDFCAESGADRLIETYDFSGNTYMPGEQVTVKMRTSEGRNALLLLYGAPFIIIFVTLLVLLKSGAGEVVAGLSSLAAGLAYYLILWIFRRSSEKAITFEIEKL